MKSHLTSLSAANDRHVVQTSSFIARSLGSLAVAAIVALGSIVVAPTLHAQVAYNESVWGDLSNDGLAPTKVMLSQGSNQIWGSTGRGSAAPDRDYFTITVPWGMQINSIKELAGTTAGGNFSFFGVEWGNQLTLPTNTQTAAGLLGWTHYASTSSDLELLPILAMPTNGSSGFQGALGAGDYSFWIQDFNAGSFSYAFDIQTSAVPVPEPSTYGAAGGLLLAGLMLYRRRQLARKTE